VTINSLSDTVHELVLSVHMLSYWKVVLAYRLCFNLALRHEGVLGEWSYSLMYS